MGVRIIVASVLLLLTGCGSPTVTGSDVTTKSEASPVATAPQLPTPPYPVIGQLAWRRDGEPTYYVVIDPVDLSNDGFKQMVKLVTQAIAEKDGDVDFSAKVYDDQVVANEALATDPGSGNTTPPDEAALDVRGQHLVAIYSGGVEANPSPYQIMWYPGAFTGTPNVGQFVSHEDWKPQV